MSPSNIARLHSSYRHPTRCSRCHPSCQWSPIYPQTVREGPGYVTNVSGTRTGLDPQYDTVLMQDQCPLPQSTFPPLPAFAPLPRLRTNLRRFFPDRPSTPLSKHCANAAAELEAAAAPSFSASGFVRCSS
ncbi:hypothetical protein V8E52_006056 [Russula decolorans]